MIKIGLVGEAPNDTTSIMHLMSKKYNQPDYEYVPMLDRINGSQLDNQKTKRLLRIEYEDKKPDILIFIRDLDSIHTKSEEFKNKKGYFSDSNRIVNKKGIFLLHIFEIEAMIVADIDAFNKIYGTETVFDSNCMLLHEPKEFLRTACNKYTESNNPTIFQELSFEKVHRNCQYFSGFINRFENLLRLGNREGDE